MHYTDNYLINPQHPITITLVGVGGTGSQVLTHLARINEALIALGHPGIFVRVFDNDNVTEANIGRQLFCKADLTLNKAVVLVSRINRYFGLSWEAHDTLFNNQKPSNILITCVDTYSARISIKNMLKTSKKEIYHKQFYWLDFGNSKHTGQVVLGTLCKIKQPTKKAVESLPTFDKIFTSVVEDINEPSCSLAQALNKQDLFINSTLSNLGCNILWKLLSQGFIAHRGVYLNLETLKTNPILV